MSISMRYLKTWSYWELSLVNIIYILLTHHIWQWTGCQHVIFVLLALPSCNNFCHHWLPSYNSFSPLAHLISTTLTSLWFCGNYNHAHAVSLYIIVPLLPALFLLILICVAYYLGSFKCCVIVSLPRLFFVKNSNVLLSHSFYPALKIFISIFFTWSTLLILVHCLSHLNKFHESQDFVFKT